MLYKKYSAFVMFLVIFSTVSIFGQNIKHLVPYDGTDASYLFEQIKADTAENHGIPADRVYELEAGGLYLCREIFYVAAGQTLRLSATGPKPIIYLYQTGTGSTPSNPPGYFVRQRGGHLEMTDIALVGIFEPDPDAIYNIQGGMIRTDGDGARIILHDCIFSNINGQVIRMESNTNKIEIMDCVFTNLGSLTTSNFGAGKGLDLRTNSCDSLIIVNSTFTNYQDRVIRHYNLTSGGTTGGIGYCLIDHNTFYDGMGFHGLFSLGNVGGTVSITNNLFVDAFAAGGDSTDATRGVEFGNTGEYYPNGANRMTWIFSAPDQTTVWSVAHNYYAISAEGQAFFDRNNPPIDAASPLSWHINSKLGADSVKAFTKIDDPQFKTAQNLMINLMNWYVDPNGGNRKKDTDKYVLADDMDRRPISFWLNDLDISYSETSPAYIGAVKGYPAGDLNWFPTLKTLWEQGVDLTDAVEKTDALPNSFSLEQNYPNPFNPSTKIVYNVPSQSKVKLDVFDILGRHVATLVDGIQAPGQYKVDFDASKLSSGVYVYQLSTQNQLFSKKMMLLK